MKDTEKDWIEKKKALLEKFSGNKEALNKEEILKQKKIYESEIEKLEDSNNSMTKRIKDLQNNISEKKIICQKVFQKSDEYKKNLTILRTKEKSFMNELTFLESESNNLSETYKQYAKGFESNILSLGSSINNMEFMKGETSSLIEKMTTLKDKVPEKSFDVEKIDEIISQTIMSLNELYDRMQVIEKNVKINYYKNRKN